MGDGAQLADDGDYEEARRAPTRCVPAIAVDEPLKLSTVHLPTGKPLSRAGQRETRMLGGVPVRLRMCFRATRIGCGMQSVQGASLCHCLANVPEPTRSPGLHLSTAPPSLRC